MADVAVNALHAAGLTPIVLLDGTPMWARAAVDQTTADGNLAPPADLAGFAAFAKAVAGRYQDRVRHYQIWDEPNIAPHWGARHISAAGYAQLLAVAAHAIRSADPDARILLAALAPTVDRGHLAQDEAYFLQRLYAAGAVDNFDFVTLQPFGFATRPDDSIVDNLRLNFHRAKLVRALMLEAGDGDTPVWLMRYGWNRQPGSPWQAVNPDRQRDFAVAALDLAYSSWPWVVAQGWADAGVAVAPDNPRAGFALTPNLAAAFQAWRARASQPRHAVVAPLSPGAWLPLLGWLAMTLALLARGIVLLRRLPWTVWRASLSRRSPFWFALPWGALLVVYYFATWPPLIALCWLLAALLIYLRPPLGLALALVLIPFHDYHKEFIWVDLHWTVPPTQALLFCLLPAAFLYKTGRILRDRWDGLAFAWLGVALLGITGAWYAPGFRYGLLELVLIPLLVFVMLRLWATTSHTIALYTAALAAGGALAAVVGLGDWLLGGGTLADGIRRLTAPTFSPNQTALYLVRSLFLMLGLMLASQGWRQWAWCVALSVTGLALVLTGSRGGLLLGLPAGAVVWFGLRDSSKPAPVDMAPLAVGHGAAAADRLAVGCALGQFGDSGFPARRVAGCAAALAGLSLVWRRPQWFLVSLPGLSADRQHTRRRPASPAQHLAGSCDRRRNRGAAVAWAGDNLVGALDTTACTFPARHRSGIAGRAGRGHRAQPGRRFSGASGPRHLELGRAGAHLGRTRLPTKSRHPDG